MTNNDDKEMYLTLLKECLLDNIYGSHILQAQRYEDFGKLGTIADKYLVDNGHYFPKRAHTMIGRKR